MPLPAEFPPPPRRPPASQALVNTDGTMTAPWLAYFDALERYQTALRNYVGTL